MGPLGMPSCGYSGDNKSSVRCASHTEVAKGLAKASAFQTGMRGEDPRDDDRAP